MRPAVLLFLLALVVQCLSGPSPVGQTNLCVHDLSDTDALVIDDSDLIEISTAAIDQAEASSAEAAARAYVRRAEAKLRLGLFDSCIKDYGSAILLTPDDIGLQVRALGAKCRLRQDVAEQPLRAEVLGKLHDVTERHPECAEAWALLAALRSEVEDFEVVQPIVERAFAADPNSPYVRLKAALLYLEDEDWQQALPHAEETIRLDPSYLPTPDSAHLARGFALLGLQEVEAARRNFEVANALAPEAINPRIGLCRAYAGLGHELAEYDELRHFSLAFPNNAVLQEMAADYRRRFSSKIRPPDPGGSATEIGKVRYDLDVAATKFLRSDTVMRLCDKWLIQVDDLPNPIQSANRSAVLHVRGTARLRSDEPELAERDFREIVESFPSNLEFRRSLAIALCRVGKHDECHEQLASLVDEQPDDLGLHLLSAELAAAEGRFSDAIEFCDKALQLDAKNAEAFYRRGLASWKLGNVESAAGDLERATWLDPTVSAPHLERAYVHLARTRAAVDGLEPAVECLLLARRLRPDDLETEFALWEVYQEAGRTDMSLYLAERMDRKFRYEPRVANALEVSRHAATSKEAARNEGITN